MPVPPLCLHHTQPDAPSFLLPQCGIERGQAAAISIMFEPIHDDAAIAYLSSLSAFPWPNCEHPANNSSEMTIAVLIMARAWSMGKFYFMPRVSMNANEDIGPSGDEKEGDGPDSSDSGESALMPDIFATQPAPNAPPGRPGLPTFWTQSHLIEYTPLSC